MGYIIIEAMSAKNLKNKALMFSMDPFVKVTAQPSGLEARCKAHKGGGRNPRWAAKGLGQLSVRVLDGDGQLLVEAWNQNSITPPDRIGSFRVDVAMLTADAQTLTLPLDTGGELVCSARRAADAEERELERAIAASLRSSSYMPSSGGTRLGGDSGADPNASNPNVTNTPTGITPSLSDELGDEIPRGRVTLRSTAVPYHVFTADWSHRERFQTAEGYEVGPSHVTASLASRGPQHVNYRVGVRQWLDDTIPAFELAPGGGRRAPPRRELVAGASAEKQLTVWRGEVRPPPEGKRPGGYAALPVKPCITFGGILGALCRIPIGNAGPGWKSGEAEWRQVCSGAVHASFGSFQRPMFDYTSVDLRYNAGAIAPRRPLAERPASELTVVERALESSGVRVESETVTLSATQQILGPLRGRFEVRCHPKALAGAVREGWRSFKTPKKESDGEGGEVYSGRFGSAWHSVRGEMSAAEVIYGVDCPLPPALGAARLVAWYNVTRAEAMAEMRLFDL